LIASSSAPIAQIATTVSHEALCRDTAAIVAHVPDPKAASAASAADAEVAVARLAAMSADLRGCAILGSDGEPLAASSDPSAWGQAARELLAAADAAAGEPVVSAHVGTEDGETFAVRHEDLAMVAAADRFTLASLMIFDMRAVLRDLASGPDAPTIRDAPSDNGAEG
jgi:hypothetical protein